MTVPGGKGAGGPIYKIAGNARPDTWSANDNDEMETAQSILHFWFGDSADDAAVIREKWDIWWKKNSKIDDDIRSRFEQTLEAEFRGELDSWGKGAHGRLARIILLDQFSRNMYRGAPWAFAFDERARALAREALEQGMDQSLRRVERVFIYMPFEHSEDPKDQETSVALFTALVAEAPEGQKTLFRDFLEYAVNHKAVIVRFGRFPHRNALLGRESTAEELEFLKRPGSSF